MCFLFLKNNNIINKSSGLNKPVLSGVTELNATLNGEQDQKVFKLTVDSLETATGFEIYAGYEENGKYSLVEKVEEKTTAMLYPNTCTYYKVRLYKLVGKKIVYGTYSNIISSCDDSLESLSTPILNGIMEQKSFELMVDTIGLATGFEIYVSEGNDIYHQLMQVEGTNTAVIYPQTCSTYKVRLYKTNGSNTTYGEFSNVIGTCDGSTDTLAVPVLKSSLNKKSLELSIDSLGTATGFEIYKMEEDNGKSFFDQKVEGTTSKALNPDHCQFYTVRLYKTNGVDAIYGPYSNIVSGCN